MNAPDPAAMRFGRSVATTALFNIAGAAAAGIAGIVIARAVGPSGRGEYAAIIAWFGVVLVIGELGQTAATTYFVAREPARAPDYLATSRTMMITSGVAALGVGLMVAGWLARGNEVTTWGYRLMFATCGAAFIGASYAFALQASNLTRWNALRFAQPALFACASVVLFVAGRLSLPTALAAMSATILAQTALAYLLCRGAGLTGGRTDLALARPMTRYGLGQLASSAPALVSARLDQLVLSVTVAPAALGQYAVAASLTALAMPVVSAVGNVAFPRMASRILAPATKDRLQRWALAVSVLVGCALMLGLASTAFWLVPAVFGDAYRDAIVLVWLLAPSGVFLACGQVCGDLLRGHGRPLAVARAQTAAAIATSALLAVLLPTIGVAGAAVASTVAYGSALALMVHTLRGISGHRRVSPAMSTAHADLASTPRSEPHQVRSNLP